MKTYKIEETQSGNGSILLHNGLFANPVGAWVSINDAVPEIGQKYDAWCRGERLANCGAFMGHWSVDDRRENMRIKECLHWMPLPQPPEDQL